MTPRIRFHVLSSAIEAGEGKLPTEFLLFAPGANDTEKGVFTFDQVAAEALLCQYKKRGVDLMIDLEHDSLSKEARALRSDAADARGWFGIELRSDGSLWAVNATWTPDGAARLLDKRQRYISPAFVTTVDAHGVERPSRLVNAAICARPATYETPALVAASSDTLHKSDLRARSYRASGYIFAQKFQRIHGPR